MATYSTDLTTMTTAESGTWTEFGDANTGGGPAADGENFIQGTDCYSQTTGTKSGLKSVVFDYTTDISGTLVTDDVILMWLYYAVGPNLQAYASDGYQVGIGTDITNVDLYTVSGSDYGRFPYGGWFNTAVDPTRTQDNVYGTGNAGAFRYFGGIVDTIAAISKGTPHAVDAIRYGRGEISVTSTGGSFSELASYNDWNSTATPPGTSSTVLDSGYHRLGLFQDQGGTYLWKGLLSLGTTASSVTFTDSNETIIIEDSAKTYLAFNKVEINNASSTIDLTNITFIATGTVAPGAFEMIDNATVDLTGCTFNSMGTFVFLSNATVSSTFNSCGLITQGGATFTTCAFNTGSASTSMLASDIEAITDCDFISDGSNHAIEITSLGDGSLTWDNVLTGYDSGVTGSPVTPTSTGNEAIYVNVGSGTVTFNVSATATLPSIRSAGATVNVVAGQIDFKFTVDPSITGYEWRLYEANITQGIIGTTELAGQETATVDNQTYTYTYSADTSVAVQIIDDNYEEVVNYYTLVNQNQDIAIQLTAEENT